MLSQSDIRKKLEAERVALLYRLGVVRSRAATPEQAAEIAGIQKKLVQIEAQLGELNTPIRISIPAIRRPVRSQRPVRRATAPDLTAIISRAFFAVTGALVGYIIYVATGDLILGILAGTGTLIVAEILKRTFR